MSGSGLDSPSPQNQGCGWGCCVPGPDLPGAFQLGDSDTTHDSGIPELAQQGMLRTYGPLPLSSLSGKDSDIS